MNELLLQLFARHGLDPTPENEAALRAALAKSTSAARSGMMKPRTVDAEARSIEAVIATEDPVEVWDYERWEPVDEVLLMKGARLAKVRKGKLPLIDAHQRDTTRRVLGSVVDLRVDGTELVGTEVFSAVSEPEFIKATEGHLDQRSVGYRVFASAYIKPGESATVEGKTFTARPNRGMSVVTDWIPLESSVVPIGADPASGTRAVVTEPEPKKDPPTMGTPAAPESPKDENRAPAVVAPAPKAETDPAVLAMRAELDALKQTVATQVNAAAVDNVFRSFAHVDGIRELADKAKADGVSLDQARAMLVDHLSKQTPSAGRAVVTKDAADKRRECAIQGLFQRANPGAKVSAEDQSRASEYRSMSLLDLARHCCEANGISTRGMDPMTIAGRAFNATGDYSHILSSTANKTLLAAYAMAPQAWSKWCKQGSLSDFKATPRVQMSQAGVLSNVPEGAEFPNGAFSDTAENIQLGSYGRIFAITRQAVINDDMDAFGAVPTMHARAWARTINQIAVKVLLSNAALHDGYALYYARTSGGSSNLDTSTTTVSSQATAEAVIRSLRKLIAAQKDADSSSYLQLMPRWVLTCPTLYRYYEQAIYETGKADNNRSVDVQRMGLDVLEEPEIENSSLTGYGVNLTYMFSDPAVAPSVEVAFLNGNSAPVMETQTGFEIDGVKMKVRGDVGAKAIDFRPTAKHVL